MLLLLQARSIEYAPVTDGYEASVEAVDQATACACTADSTNGSANLPSNLFGCKQHSLDMGDTDYYCYVQGGSDCAAATPSNTYQGDCTIKSNCFDMVPGAEGDRCTACVAVGLAVRSAAVPWLAGAAWTDCTPPVAQSTGPSAAQPQSGASSNSQSAASLLGSWLGQWLAAPRDGPNMTTPFSGNSTVARNRTAAGVSSNVLSRRVALPVARG
jgi:hypothetical protein